MHKRANHKEKSIKRELGRLNLTVLCGRNLGLDFLREIGKGVLFCVGRSHLGAGDQGPPRLSQGPDLTQRIRFLSSTRRQAVRPHDWQRSIRSGGRWPSGASAASSSAGTTSPAGLFDKGWGEGTSTADQSGPAKGKQKTRRKRANTLHMAWRTDGRKNGHLGRRTVTAETELFSSPTPLPGNSCQGPNRISSMAPEGHGGHQNASQTL